MGTCRKLLPCLDPRSFGLVSVRRVEVDTQQPASMFVGLRRSQLVVSPVKLTSRSRESSLLSCEVLLLHEEQLADSLVAPRPCCWLCRVPANGARGGGAEASGEANGPASGRRCSGRRLMISALLMCDPR